MSEEKLVTTPLNKDFDKTTPEIRVKTQRLANEYMRPSGKLNQTDIEDPLNRDTSLSRFNSFVLDNLSQSPKIEHPSVKDPTNPQQNQVFKGSDYAQALDDMVNQYSRQMAEALFRVFREESLGFARTSDSIRSITFKNSNIRSLHVEIDIPGKSRLLIGPEILNCLQREPLSLTINGEIVSVTPEEFFKNPDRFTNNPEIKDIIVGRLERLIRDRIRDDLSEYMRIHGKLGLNNLIKLFNVSVPFKVVMIGEFDTVPTDPTERQERITGTVLIPSSRISLDVKTTPLSRLFYQLYTNYGKLKDRNINLGDLRAEYRAIRFAAPLIIGRLAVRFKSGDLVIPDKYSQVAKVFEELIKRYESDPESTGESPKGFYKWLVDRCAADERFRDSMVRLLLDLTLPGAIVQSPNTMGPSLPPILAFYVAPESGGPGLLLQNDPSGRGLSRAIQESIRLSGKSHGGVRIDVLSNTGSNTLNFTGRELTSLADTMRDHPVRTEFFKKMAAIVGLGRSNAFLIAQDGNLEHVKDKNLSAIMENDSMAVYLDGLVTLCEVVLKDQITQPLQNPQAAAGSPGTIPPAQRSPSELLIPMGSTPVTREIQFIYDVMTGWKQQ